MKKPTTKRLHLTRQTLAQLTGPELTALHGGLPPQTASACLDKGCVQPTRTGCVTRTQDCV